MSQESKKIKSVGEIIAWEVKDFYESKLILASGKEGTDGGYTHNPSKTQNAIDLAVNSKFSTGDFDSQRRRKFYLNVVTFRRDVAIMQVDMDIANYLFVPDGFGQIYSSALFARDFKVWNRHAEYGVVKNKLTEDLCTYGHEIVKRVGDRMERVPIRKMCVTPDASSIEEAATNGGYAIQIHNLTYHKLKQMPDWDTSTIEPYHGKKKFYERYGLVSIADYKRYSGKKDSIEDDDEQNYKLAMTIATLDKTTQKKTNNVHFIEFVDKTPYEEEKWDETDGRWMGLGPVEKLLQNQFMANFTGNIRKNSLEWHVKRVFQSSDPQIQRNLAKEVADGDVLEILPGGDVKVVDTANRGMAEIQSMEVLLDRNSDQVSFTHESATGESQPSGTPFRLGVLQERTVQKHFGYKKEKHGLFFKRTYYDHITEIFINESEEHTLTVAWDEEGIELLRKAYMRMRTNDVLRQSYWKDKNPITKEEAEAKVMEQLRETPYMFWKIKKHLYKNIKFQMELVLTGESIEVNRDKETLTNLYSSMIQSQNPDAQQKANHVLSLILAMENKTMEGVFGPDLGDKAPQQIQNGEVPINNLIPQQQNVPV